MAEKSASRSGINMPSWLFDVVKIIVPVIAVFIGMYVKVEGLKKDTAEVINRVEKMETLREAQADVIRQNQAQIGQITTRIEMIDKTVRETLNDVKSDLKEVKGDLKTALRSLPKE